MKVIVALDDSPYSIEVINEVISRQWPSDTQFKILSVVEPITIEEIIHDKWADVIQDAHAQHLQDAHHLCAKAREKLEINIPDCIVHFEIREGEVKAEIIDAAIEWSADKLMLGAHGKGICPRFMLGSVSRTVAAHAPCSVEIVRPKVSRQKKPLAANVSHKTVKA